MILAAFRWSTRRRSRYRKSEKGIFNGVSVNAEHLMTCNEDFTQPGSVIKALLLIKVLKVMKVNL